MQMKSVLASFSSLCTWTRKLFHTPHIKGSCKILRKDVCFLQNPLILRNICSWTKMLKLFRTPHIRGSCKIFRKDVCFLQDSLILKKYCKKGRFCSRLDVFFTVKLLSIRTLIKMFFFCVCVCVLFYTVL